MRRKFYVKRCMRCGKIIREYNKSGYCSNCLIKKEIKELREKNANFK